MPKVVRRQYCVLVLETDQFRNECGEFPSERTGCWKYLETDVPGNSWRAGKALALEAATG